MQVDKIHMRNKNIYQEENDSCKDNKITIQLVGIGNR